MRLFQKLYIRYHYYYHFNYNTIYLLSVTSLSTNDVSSPPSVIALEALDGEYSDTEAMIMHQRN